MEVQQDNNNDGDFVCQESRAHSKTKSDTIILEVPKKLFKTPEVVSMMDRTQITSRKAVGLASAILKSAGADLSDFSLSYRQVQRQRDQARLELAKTAFDEFQAYKPENAVIHWDSKLIDDVHGSKSEKLAVLVSGGLKM